MQLDFDKIGLGVEEDSGKNSSMEVISPSANNTNISPSNNYSDAKMESQHEDHEALVNSSNNSSHLVNNNPSTKSQSNNITPSPTTTTTKLDTTNTSTVTERKSNGVITSKDSQKENNDNSKNNSVETDGYLSRTDNLQGLEDPAPPPKIVWRNVIIFAYVHVAVLYSVYLILSGNVMWQTLAFGKLL